MNKPLIKLTMQTPGRRITIELPKWMEKRILTMFITASRKRR